MENASIVIPQGAAVLNSVVRVFGIFNWVNEYSSRNRGRALFEVHLVGMAPRTDLYGGIVSVMPDLTLADALTSDLIIIPALAGDISECLKSNTAFIPWMKEQYKMGAEIAGLCTGVFLLAATGLMNGNKHTAHWFVAADCRDAFCQIKLGAERMSMKEERIHSRRGAYFSLNLLIEKFAGAEIAMACSEVFETELQSRMPVSSYCFRPCLTLQHVGCLRINSAHSTKGRVPCRKLARPRGFEPLTF